MKFFKELIGTKNTALIINVDEDIESINAYLSQIIATQENIDRIKTQLFSLQQTVFYHAQVNAMAQVIDQKKTIDIVEEYELLESGPLFRLYIDINQLPHPVVKNICLANFLLALQTNSTLVIFHDGKAPIIDYKLNADFDRALLQLKSLSTVINKLLQLLTTTSVKMLNAQEKAFFNLNLQYILKATISTTLNAACTFTSNQYTARWQELPHEMHVPKAFHASYPHVEKNTDSGQAIFTQIQSTIASAINYLGQDSALIASLPNMAALTITFDQFNQLIANNLPSPK